MANGKILLVEGTDDEHVLKHICGNRDIPHLDEVKSCGNDIKLIENLEVRLKVSEEGDVIGVVIDADTDIADRWKSIRHRITDADVGYQNVPSQPDPEGTILDPPAGTLLPRLGVWIMPNNQISGILEDFCTSLFRNLISFLTMRKPASKIFLMFLVERGFSNQKTSQRQSSILGLLGKKIRDGLSGRPSPPASSIPMFQR